MSKLSCGGKGPCCHVGYAHRHCAHCDVVIDTRAGYWPYNPPYWLNNPVWSAAQNGNDLRLQLMNAGTQTSALPEHTCEASA